MNCPTCQAALPEDAGFCGHCGGALGSERKCARCGRSNSPEMRFCLGCGAALSPAAPAQAPRTYTPKHLVEKILTSRSALEGECKQVTVLFCDVKGSMDLAEQIGPEEWHKIMDRFFAILSDGVHRFEGTINQYTGDGIMALFGAPIAHEDHAQRACLAALYLQHELRRYADEMRLEHGLGFPVRMGLNSGEVVVGKIGDDLRMDCSTSTRPCASPVTTVEANTKRRTPAATAACTSRSVPARLTDGLRAPGGSHASSDRR
jgi:class 3 adenylate cyclase